MSSDPLLGSLMLTAFPFAPKGWAHCDGQLLSIAQNQALFALLGTTYGGSGTTTFALPDLRGRVPVGTGSFLGQPYVLGQVGGAERVTLLPHQLPVHTHQLVASGRQADAMAPDDALLAAGGQPRFGTGAAVPMSGAVVSAAGGNQPHDNRGPSLVLSWVIALQGIFPSRP